MRTIKYALNVITYSRFRSIIVFILVFVTTVCIFGTGLFTDNIKSGADKLNGTTNTDLYIVPQEYLDSTKDQEMSADQVSELKAKQEKLTTSAQALFTKMYEQAQQANGGAQGAAGQNMGGSQSAPHDDNVVDGDFREV